MYSEYFWPLRKKVKKSKAPPRFELGISCLLDRRFNQLSHGAAVLLRGHLLFLSPGHAARIRMVIANCARNWLVGLGV